VLGITRWFVLNVHGGPLINYFISVLFSIPSLLIAVAFYLIIEKPSHRLARRFK